MAKLPAKATSTLNEGGAPQPNISSTSTLPRFILKMNEESSPRPPTRPSSRIGRSHTHSVSILTQTAINEFKASLSRQWAPETLSKQSADDFL